MSSKVDILIKDIDLISLIDLMDTIKAYQLKYTFSPDETIDPDNDTRFNDIMSEIILSNDTLPLSIEPLINEVEPIYHDCIMYGDQSDENMQYYEHLIEKINEIKFTE